MPMLHNHVARRAALQVAQLYYATPLRGMSQKKLSNTCKYFFWIKKQYAQIHHKVYHRLLLSMHKCDSQILDFTTIFTTQGIGVMSPRVWWVK